MLAEVAVAGPEGGPEALAVLRVERVEQPPGSRKDGGGVANLDPVEPAGVEQLPRPPRRHRRKPGRHERVSDDREATGVVDGVNRVLNRHVHADLPFQVQPDHVDAGRKRRGHLLAPDDGDTQCRAGIDRRSELGDRVVVGDAQNVQPDRGSCANQVLGAHHAIARKRVGMDLGEPEPVAGVRAQARCLLHRPSVIGRSVIAFGPLRVR